MTYLVPIGLVKDLICEISIGRKDEYDLVSRVRTLKILEADVKKMF